MVKRKGAFGIHECMMEHEYNSKRFGDLVTLQDTKPPERKRPVRIKLEWTIVLLFKDLIEDLFPIWTWRVHIFLHKFDDLT